MSSRILMATAAALALAVPAAAQDQAKPLDTGQEPNQQLEQANSLCRRRAARLQQATEPAQPPTTAEDQPAEQPAQQQAAAEEEATPPADMKFLEVQDEAQFLADDEVIGKDVVNVKDEKVGTIADLVMDQEQKLVGVVLSVGGFLGLGDKGVAIPVEQIQFPAADQPARLLVAVTEEQLKNAPDFKTRATLEAEDAAAQAQQQQMQHSADSAARDHDAAITDRNVSDRGQRAAAPNVLSRCAGVGRAGRGASQVIRHWGRLHARSSMERVTCPTMPHCQGRSPSPYRLASVLGRCRPPTSSRRRSRRPVHGFLELLDAAGMAETLKGEGPFTVFAPTDEAFDQLPPAMLDQLLAEEEPEALEAVVQSHIVADAAIRAATSSAGPSSPDPRRWHACDRRHNRGYLVGPHRAHDHGGPGAGSLGVGRGTAGSRRRCSSSRGPRRAGDNGRSHGDRARYRSGQRRNPRDRILCFCPRSCFGHPEQGRGSGLIWVNTQGRRGQRATPLRWSARSACLWRSDPIGLDRALPAPAVHQLDEARALVHCNRLRHLPDEASA